MMPLQSLACCVYMVLGLLLISFDIMWRRQCMAQANGGSYARWRELLAVLFRLGMYGQGLASHITASWLSQLGSKGSARSHTFTHARHAALLIFISGVPTGLIMWTSTLRIM